MIEGPAGGPYQKDFEREPPRANSLQPLAPILVDPQSKSTMDAMDDETRRRLEEEIVKLQAQHEETLKKTFLSQEECNKELNQIKTAI